MTFLTLILLSSTPHAQSSIEEQWEPFVNDTFLRLHHLLTRTETSGDRQTVFLRAGSHRWEAKTSSGDGLIKYWIGHEPVHVQVENWNSTGNRLQADRIIFQRPVVRIFQGKPVNLDNYLKDRKLFQAEPATFSDDSPETFEIGIIEIQNGRIEMVNTDTSPVSTIEMVNFNGTVSGLTVPDWLLHTPFEYQLELFLNSSQPAMVKARHTDTTEPESINFHFHLDVEGLDLAYLAPFIIAEEGWSLTQGTLDLVVDATSVDNRFRSLNRITLDGLAFSSSRAAEKSLNDFALQVLLQASRSVLGAVRLNYEVQGNLADPDFSMSKAYEKAIEQSLTQWLVLQTLRQIGLENNPTLRKQFGLEEIPE